MPRRQEVVVTVVCPSFTIDLAGSYDSIGFGRGGEGRGIQNKKEGTNRGRERSGAACGDGLRCILGRVLDEPVGVARWEMGWGGQLKESGVQGGE